MKIFIIHASAGSGHKKIAEAVYEEAISRFPKENVSFFDVLDYTPKTFKFLYSKGYIFLISRLQWLWGLFFYLADTKYLRLINKNLRCFINKILCKNFLDLIKKESPDVIISTHFLVNELISEIKKEDCPNLRLVSVITDFAVHNFWIAKNVDLYVVACHRTKEILVSKGISKDKIKVFGIPIRKRFEQSLNKEELRKKFSINDDKFTALILTGGVGIGPIYKIVETINDRINLIVVCGNNNNLLDQLKKSNFRNLTVFGWIDNIEEVMCVSDIIITKPGGSTISEALIVGLPMIFFSIIPGQESFNAKIISELNMGLIAYSPNEINHKIVSFLNNPASLDILKRNVISCALHNSSQKILDLI